MASLYTSEMLPSSSVDAIRVFDERYLAGISSVQPPSWAEEIGESVGLTAPTVRFPISFLATKYLETREESGRFKTMKDKTFDLNVIEYDAGYEAELIYLKTNVWAYRNWTSVPGRFLQAEKRHLNRAIATLLTNGTSELSPWDGVAFFSTAHKANPGGDPATTWSNYQSVAKDVTNISLLMAEVSAMKEVLDENGEKMLVDPDIIIVPTGKAEALNFILAQQLILQGSATAPTSNPYNGTFRKFRVIEAPELTDVNDWYLIDSKLMASYGVPPWLSAKYQAPADLGLRFFDESSDYFKNTGKIKVSSHIWYGFKLLFPHAIRKVVGA
jgi:hypothetical protein